MAHASDEGEDSWLERIRDRDAFIVYEEDDEYEVFKTVLQYFDSNGLAYALPQIEYPGGSVMPSMSKAIGAAKKVLLILSKNSNNARFSLETFLALEKCVKNDQLCLTILTLRGFERANIAHIPMLQNATIVELDYNRQERCLEAVVKHIKEENTRLSVVIPAGNFATGLAWSHFTGYLKIILPEIQTKIRESRTYRENPGQFVERFFILLPRSGRAFPLADDSEITRVDDETLAVKKTVDGAPRTYSPPVYRVTAGNGQPHFCCAEIPSAFGTIGKVFEDMLQFITSQQRANEVERFFYKLQEIISHQLNDRLSETVEMIVYDDERKDDSAMASYQLLKRINGSGATPDLPQTPRMEKKKKHDVCLIYASCDSNHAFKVKVALEEKKKRVVKVELPDESICDSEERVESSAWVILLMSNNAMSMPRSNCMPIWMANVLSVNLEDNELRVIPLLIDAEPSAIPDFIRWVTYISINEEGYKDRILDIINGKPISMKSQSPVGNVAYGLAWAFFENYLKHALKDLEIRSKAKLKEISADPRKCMSIVFEFIPKSGKTINKLDEIETNKYGIESFGSVRQIETSVSGVRRGFDVNMYGIYIKNGGKREFVQYFMGEFAAPLRTLRSMHDSFIAGLNNEQLINQITQFSEDLKYILSHVPTDPNTEVQKLCEPVLFDDTKDNLIDVLLNEIEKLKAIRRFTIPREQ